MNIAYQGIPGCYSEAAAKRFYPKTPTLACQDFREVFAALEEGRADLGLIPIENSLGGSIHANYDLLATRHVEIIAEHNYAITHCLLSNQKLELTDLLAGSKPRCRVYSHPQALEQCRDRLAAWGFQACEYYDTAGAAQYIASGSDSGSNTSGSNTSDTTHTFALASAQAAETYGLHVLYRGAADDPDNYTRFLTIRKCDHPDMTPQIPLAPYGHKTTLAFHLQNSVGALGRVLSVFALNDVDLCHIESRPLRPEERPNTKPTANPFQYRFTLEADLDTTTAKGLRCLETLRLHTHDLRLLGCYPADPTRYSDAPPLRIGLLGFGPFGRYVAAKLAPLSRLSVWSRSDNPSYREEARRLGVSFTIDLQGFLGQTNFDVLLLCVSMQGLEPLLKSLGPALITAYPNRPPLVVDVLSVKCHPAKLLQSHLPDACDLLLTHPMFGPESCPGQLWTDAPLVYHPLCIQNTARLGHFLDLFRECRLIEMTPEEHDRLAAKSQFVAHTLGQVLNRLQVTQSQIDTSSFRHLLALQRIVGGDSEALFRGLFRYNEEAPRILEHMQASLEAIRQELIADD